MQRYNYPLSSSQMMMIVLYCERTTDVSILHYAVGIEIRLHFSEGASLAAAIRLFGNPPDTINLSDPSDPPNPWSVNVNERNKPP